MKKIVDNIKTVTLDYGPGEWGGRTLTLTFHGGKLTDACIEYIGGDHIPAHGQKLWLIEEDIMLIHKMMHDAWKVKMEIEKEERA